MEKDKKQASGTSVKSAKANKKEKAGKNDKKGKKTRITGGGTVGYTVKPIRGQYYNLVDSLDGLKCPPVPQSTFTGPSRAPREPPCCPPSTCCYPPPCCPRQPGRRCC